MKEYFQHKPTCSQLQDWTEAEQAFADTPQSFRDADYYVAIEEMHRKRSICNCGMEAALLAIELKSSVKPE